MRTRPSAKASEASRPARTRVHDGAPGAATRSHVTDRAGSFAGVALQKGEPHVFLRGHPMIHLWSSVQKMRACARRRLALVVDDDDAFRQFAMRGLLRVGCTSVGLSTADEALRWIDDASEVPVLIALDARLTRGDGVQLCSSIRKNARVADVPVLCASSLVEAADRLLALRAGVDVFLPKPVGADDYLEAAARLLRGGGHAKQAREQFIGARRM
jgi:two-component system, chemotaxis family, response regulator PixH